MHTDAGRKVKKATLMSRLDQLEAQGQTVPSLPEDPQMQPASEPGKAAQAPHQQAKSGAQLAAASSGSPALQLPASSQLSQQQAHSQQGQSQQGQSQQGLLAAQSFTWQLSSARPVAQDAPLPRSQSDVNIDGMLAQHSALADGSIDWQLSSAPPVLDAEAPVLQPNQGAAGGSRLECSALHSSMQVSVAV